LVYHKQQMNSIIKFHTDSFINALKAFFEELKVPVDYLADEPASPTDVLGERFKAPTKHTNSLQMCMPWVW
jgi:hypothetical protein